MNRQGYTGLQGDLTERENAKSRLTVSNPMIVDYLSGTVQVGPFSYNYSTSSYDSFNTGGLSVSPSWGLSANISVGEIQATFSDRASLTRGFIDGRSAAIGGCAFVCAGFNISYDDAGKPTLHAREVGLGIGIRAGTGALVRGFSPSLSVGRSSS